jgi:hypothetical protein
LVIVLLVSLQTDKVSAKNAIIKIFLPFSPKKKILLAARARL